MKSLEDIIDLLIQVTENKRLYWEATGNRFKAALPDSIFVMAWLTEDQDTGESVAIAQLVKGDEVVDAIQANQFTPQFPDLVHLINSARRSANNVDAVIGDITKTLLSL